MVVRQDFAPICVPMASNVVLKISEGGGFAPVHPRSLWQAELYMKPRVLTLRYIRHQSEYCQGEESSRRSIWERQRVGAGGVGSAKSLKEDHGSP